MKKSFFLSAILVLMSGAFVHGMESANNARPPEFRMIDEALVNADWPAIFDLLDITPNLVNAYETARGSTLLSYTVGRNDLLLTRTLLDKYEADPNRGGFKLAITEKNIPMIKLLLEYGANPDLPIKGGMTARKYALMIVKEHPEILELIESFDRK